MHMMELAPKGTGKSYVYEKHQPAAVQVDKRWQCIACLCSPVNNMSGQWGLLRALLSSRIGRGPNSEI
jgi:ATP-dependent Lon protease